MELYQNKTGPRSPILLKFQISWDMRKDSTLAHASHTCTSLATVCTVRKKERKQVLTPNICLRSGSLNLKGILETWSLLGCDLFSVFSDDCVCCWLSVCAESSVCCVGKKGKEIREYQKVRPANFDVPTVNKLNKRRCCLCTQVFAAPLMCFSTWSIAVLQSECTVYRACTSRRSHGARPKALF